MIALQVKLTDGDQAALRAKGTSSVLRRILDRNPDRLNSRLNLIATYVVSEKEEAARAEATEVLRQSPDFSVEQFLKDVPYKDQWILDGLKECLTRAGLK